MRNLKCVHQSRVEIDSTLPCTASTWDPVNDAIIYALGPSAQSPIIELRRTLAKDFSGVHTSVSTLVASWDAYSPLPDLPVDHVVSLRYLASGERSCLVLAGGDMIVVRDDPLPEQDKIEIVGSVDAGITAAAWTPEEDLLSVTTRADTLLFMTADFDNVASASFTPDDAKLSRQVNVGWGKAETQFKGKGAKALRDPTMPERVDEGILSPHDDFEVSMSWRGDGAFVAISSVEEGKRRMNRVFARDGTLDSVTEAVDGLEGSISWKPSGQLISGIQRSEGKYQVVFFERNGLRHGEFSLGRDHESSIPETQRIKLSWNLDSTVLGVCYEDKVQFWTVGNYHYYMKYEVALEKTVFSESNTSIVWHPEDPLRCLIHQFSGIGVSQPKAAIRSVKFALAVSRGSMLPPHDLGHTAVIDGKRLLFTPLRLANVPPPMALHELEIPSSALDAAFSPLSDKLAILHASSISIFGLGDKSTISHVPDICRTLVIPSSGLLVPLQLCFGDAEELAVLFQDLASSSVKVYSTKSSTWLYEGPSKRSAAIASTPDSSKLVILTDNAATELDPVIGSSGKSPGATCRFPGLVSTLEPARNQASTFVFGLAASGALYANEKLLMRNCTSFLLTDTHLLTTTTTHLLKFTLLDDTAAEALEIPEDQPDADELCRSVERGSKLVTAVPSTFAVILQMPRGNIETIYPRALVLSGIRKQIEAKDYRKAFIACRSHRVDMNILHDHAPAQFMDCVELIIDQLKKTEYIDLFLSQLSENDVTQTLYKNPNLKMSAQAREENKLRFSDKVNRICDSFLSVLHHRYSTNLQNVITANLCKAPPDIEAGLRVIHALQSTNLDMVDDAVEHICFLADVNKIYEAALGIYDLDLALLIAQQSQKDPREYLPYLRQLQELDEGRRNFQIDDDLGRRIKALEHLYAVSTIDEVEAYALKHELHAKALQLCKYNEKHHDRLMRSYAELLDSQSRFKEAAVAYESLNDYHAASAAYRAVNLWRESLSCAQLAAPPIPTSDLSSLAESLALALEESKDFQAAAQVQADYLLDVASAIRLLCKGHYFSEALRTAAIHAQPALIPELVDPGLGEGFGTLTELLAECKGQLNAQVPRVRDLRSKRAADPLAFLEGAPTAADGTDVPDDLSLAGSMTSTHASTLLTRYTARSGNTTLQTGASRKTSRNKKREERKRARGKKGSAYEEEYLVNSVGRLIERVNSTGPEVERTVDALCRRGMWERAEALENAMREVVGMCEACVPEVWEVDREHSAPAAPHEDAGGAEDYKPVGGERVLWESIGATKKARTPPLVAPYAGSALLAK